MLHHIKRKPFIVFHNVSLEVCILFGTVTYDSIRPMLSSKPFGSFGSISSRRKVCWWWSWQEQWVRPPAPPPSRVPHVRCSSGGVFIITRLCYQFWREPLLLFLFILHSPPTRSPPPGSELRWPKTTIARAAAAPAPLQTFDRARAAAPAAGPTPARK